MKTSGYLFAVLLLISSYCCSTLVCQTFQHDSSHTGVYSSRGIHNAPRIAWQYQTDGPVLSSPVVYAGHVYVGSCDGYLYAFDKESGKQIWKVRTAGQILSTPAIADGIVVVVGGEGACYAVDAAKGTFLWRATFGVEKQYDVWDYFRSSPVIAANTVIFGSGDGYVYAVDLHSGTLRWKFETQAIVHASPAVSGDTVFVGDYDGGMYALNITDGSFLWRFKTVGDTYYPKGEIQGSACVANGMVFFGSRDYNIYALDESSGQGKWNFKVPFGWVISTPAFANGTVYFGTSDAHRIYAMDAMTGVVKWVFRANLNFFSSCAVANNIIYAGCMNGKLYALHAETGDTAWVFQTQESKIRYATVMDSTDRVRKDIVERSGHSLKRMYEMFLDLGSILSSPAVDGGFVFFGSTDGSIYALEER